MKKIIQIFLFLTIILISVFFHKKYFLEKKVNKEIMLESKKEVELENKNNLIKNLKYDVVLNNNSQYSITSDLSEIMYIDNKF